MESRILFAVSWFNDYILCFELGAARTNKKEFLEKLEHIIPWTEFIKLIEPHYYKGERGNKPYPLELMHRKLF